MFIASLGMVLALAAFFSLVAIAATVWDQPAAPALVRLGVPLAAFLAIAGWLAWRWKRRPGWLAAAALAALACGCLAGPTTRLTLAFWLSAALAVAATAYLDHKLDQPLDGARLKAERDALPPGERDFTPEARAWLWRIVRGVSRNDAQVGYQLLGFEDLADQERAAAMLRALAENDWEAVRTHRAITGLGDMLLGLVLRIAPRAGETRYHWVLLKSPGGPFDNEAVVTHDRAISPPDGDWEALPA